MRYAELHCKSNFSFLEGASHADELFSRAAELNYGALAITDRNSLAGIVRAHTAAKDADLRLIVGVELHPVDGPPLVVWPIDRAAYGRLCRLLTKGRFKREKGSCHISWHDIIAASEGLLAGLLLRHPSADQGTEENHQQLQVDSEQQTVELPAAEFDRHDHQAWLAWLQLHRQVFADRAYLFAELHRGVDDQAKLQQLMHFSQHSQVPLLAGGDVHYHTAERSILHDCLLATRLNTTVDQIRSQRLPNSQFHLRSLERISQIYAACPDAIERTMQVADRIQFSLNDLR